MTGIRQRWLIDLGNSRLKCAALDAHGLRAEAFAIGHEQSDPLASLLNFVGQVGVGDEVWLASVAPAQRTAAVTQDLQRSGLSVHRIATQAQCGRLRIAYPEPAQLGVDRFLALLAASERKDGPWVVVSAGSALTIDVLASDGRHLGGMIAPMPQHMRAVLAQNFPQLNLPEGQARDFADNTADAIATGARTAALGAVERALRKAGETLGSTPTLLLAGGNADLFAGLDHAQKRHLPSLVLDGMALFVRGMER
jgi:type III pantothenate kinase